MSSVSVKEEYRRHPETGLPQRFVDAQWVDLHPSVDVKALNRGPVKPAGKKSKGSGSASKS